MGNYPSTLLHHLADQLEQAPSHALVVQRYGWHPDVPDRRDLCLSHYPTDSDDEHVVSGGSTGDSAPDGPPDVLSVDLRQQMPAVYDDDGLGCSTVSALAALLEFHELQTRPHTSYEPSRLYWYYLVRDNKGVAHADTGASFREALKVLNDEGVCDEVDWPFDAANCTHAPYWSCYEATPRSRPAVYRRVPQTLDALKHCLTNDQPVAFGLSVYDSFEAILTRRTGRIHLPGCAADLVEPPVVVEGEATEAEATDGAITHETEADDHLGGHALVLVGYDDADQMFVVRNSQGAAWGANGYGYIPYAYVLNPMLARDFWVLDGDAASVGQATADEGDAVVSEPQQDEATNGDAASDASATDTTETGTKDDANAAIPPLFHTLLDRVGY